MSRIKKRTSYKTSRAREIPPQTTAATSITETSGRLWNEKGKVPKSRSTEEKSNAAPGQKKEATKHPTEAHESKTHKHALSALAPFVFLERGSLSMTLPENPSSSMYRLVPGRKESSQSLRPFDFSSISTRILPCLEALSQLTLAVEHPCFYAAHRAAHDLRGLRVGELLHAAQKHRRALLGAKNGEGAV